VPLAGDSTAGVMASDEPSREQRYFDALCWALGTGDFAPRQPGQGAFWWRPELQRRAGLKWDGDKFVPAGETGQQENGNAQ
jgi:hypothetical protein